MDDQESRPPTPNPDLSAARNRREVRFLITSDLERLIEIIETTPPDWERITERAIALRQTTQAIGVIDQGTLGEIHLRLVLEDAARGEFEGRLNFDLIREDASTTNFLFRRDRNNRLYSYRKAPGRRGQLLDRGEYDLITFMSGDTEEDGTLVVLESKMTYDRTKLQRHLKSDKMSKRIDPLKEYLKENGRSRASIAYIVVTPTTDPDTQRRRQRANVSTVNGYPIIALPITLSELNLHSSEINQSYLEQETDSPQPDPSSLQALKDKFTNRRQ